MTITFQILFATLQDGVVALYEMCLSDYFNKLYMKYTDLRKYNSELFPTIPS